MSLHEVIPQPEVELILGCARSRLETDQAEHVRMLVQGRIDWDYVLRTSYAHGVAPLIYRNLRALCSEAVPKDSLSLLRGVFESNAAKSLYLTGELVRLLQLLEKVEIKAVPFKGPVLAASVYGDFSSRQFTDLDILVHEKDFIKAKALLLSIGYQPWRTMTPQEETQHFRREHAYTLVRSDGGVRVDLHWKIAQGHYSFGLNSEDLWQRVQPLSIAGTTVLNLSAEDSLLFFCMHGAKHCWERLGWICDLAELVRAQQSINWERIMCQAQSSGVERIIFLGLNLAHELLNAALPNGVLTKIASDPEIPLLSRQIQKQMFSTFATHLGPVRRVALFLRTRERLRHRIPYLRYSFRLAVTPNEVDLALLALPRMFNFAYYPLRLFRLAAVYGREIASRFYSAKYL